MVENISIVHSLTIDVILVCREYIRFATSKFFYANMHIPVPHQNVLKITT